MRKPLLILPALGLLIFAGAFFLFTINKDQEVVVRIALAEKSTVDSDQNDLQASISSLGHEIIANIAESEDWRVEYVRLDSDAAAKAVSACEVQIALLPAGAEKSLAADVIRSRPFFRIGQSILLRAGASGVSGIEDLTGKAVGAVYGSPALTEAGKMTGLRVIPYETADSLVQSVQAGNLDAGLVDTLLAYAYADWSKGALKVAPNPYADTQYPFYLCARERARAATISSHLDALLGTDLYSSLISRWIIESGHS